MHPKCLLGAAALLARIALGQAEPPATVIDPVADRFGQVRVVDDYRWLEDSASPRTKDWVERQNTYTRSFLDRLPDRDPIRLAKREMEAGTHVAYAHVRVSNGVYFALRDAPPNEQSVLVAMTNPDDLSTEHTIVDPNRIDAKGGVAINWYRPSPDGRFVAVCLSDNTERGDIHVFESANGRPTGDVVPRVNFATASGSLAWLADGNGFLYTHYPRPGERVDADLDFYVKIYRHKLGTTASQDTYEIGNAFPKLAEIRLLGGDHGWQFARVADGDSPRYAFYARSPLGVWSRFLTPKDGVIDLAQAGDRLLLLSTQRSSTRRSIDVGVGH